MPSAEIDDEKHQEVKMMKPTQWKNIKLKAKWMTISSWARVSDSQQNNHRNMTKKSSV